MHHCEKREKLDAKSWRGIQIGLTVLERDMGKSSLFDLRQTGEVCQHAPS